MEDIEKEIEKILDRLYSWGYECGINQMMGGAPIYGEDMLSTDEALKDLTNLINKACNQARIELIKELKEHIQTLPTWETSTMIEGEDVLSVLEAKEKELNNEL